MNNDSNLKCCFCGRCGFKLWRLPGEIQTCRDGGACENRRKWNALLAPVVNELKAQARKELAARVPLAKAITR